MHIDDLINATETNHLIGQTFIELATVNSTNSYAIDQIQANLAAHGNAYFAFEQTAGRGQRGKEWNSSIGENIVLSITLAPNIAGINNLFELSQTIALACCSFFNKYTNGDCTIKWPNDIYWNDRKAGGILIENIYRGQQWQWAIIGIGLNINQTHFPDFGSKKAVSLKQITGINYPIIGAAKELCNYINYFINVLISQPSSIHQTYINCLYKKNQFTKLLLEEKVLYCEIIGVSTTGELLVKHNEEIKALAWGSVTWI